nr:uncharacterized protein LOC123757877 [Procambarus clarkii]
MKLLSLVVLLLVMGYARCECKPGSGGSEGRYRSVSGCPITRMFQPVCGTDGCDYINESALNCAYRDDLNSGLSEEEAVKMAYMGHCNQRDEANNIMP